MLAVASNITPDQALVILEQYVAPAYYEDLPIRENKRSLARSMAESWDVVWTEAEWLAVLEDDE